MAAAGPDIGQLLASLGGGQGGPPPDAAQGPQGPQDTSGGQPIELLKQIISVIQQYLQAEPDEEDKLQGTKLLQLAQQLLAKDQQDRDQAMGGSSQRILRKAG